MEGTAANQSLLRCHELSILIDGIEVKALLDTGSEITCISQEFYEKHSNVSLIFLVVPKLIKECIIGYDSQKGLKMLIDTSREEIYMTINHSDENVSYKETTLDIEK